jgi:predicted CoA-substrate-specific enzyme activase
VFAKSDMIHLQQKGTPLEEIAYGLCQALARNYVATILKGRENLLPVLLTGGGFQNRGLVRAFREVLSLQDGTFVLSQAPSYTSALGAALAATQAPHPLTVGEIHAWVSGTVSGERRVSCFLPPLGDAAPPPPEEPEPEEGEFVRGYLGVDVGSVSTNLALVDGEGRVKAGVYLPTRGRPLEVIREGCEQLFDRCSGGLEILGIGTTGSGRHLAGEYLEADEVRNEITCQLAGTLPYFPEADTIFEIGGQDSKFIKLQDGRIQDFTMNKICAAGTGSFLEEQAELLDLDIQRDFSRLAHQSGAPSDLGSQCTVFMESELVNALSRGESVSDVTAGLAFAIVRNYLEKVVAERPVGDHIVFQGGVASNPAVVNAFARLLERPVPVHPYNRISGAIGAALITRRTVEQKGKVSPDLAQLQERIRRPFLVSSFQCRHCANRCQVNRIDLGNRLLFFGDICERYTVKQRARRPDVGADEARDRDITVDLFEEWRDALQESLRNPPEPSHTVGIPSASLLMGDIPFWAAFFNHLGCKVLLSPPSHMDILNSGLKKIPVETCLPVKLAYGHVHWFADRKVDFVFIPSYVHHSSEDGYCEQNCPYAEHIPWMLRSTSELSIESPQVNLGFRAREFLRAMSETRRRLGKTKDEFARALDFAHERFNEFRRRIQVRGKEVLEQFRRSGRDVWVITGKPYNVHDPFVNLNLALHLKRMDVCVVPQDYIPEDIPDSTSGPGLPPWRHNQRMIAISHWCRGQAGTYPLVISNFGCGPDAFTQKHISRILRSTPHLWLEFDEHRAEAGLITRLEAFYDEISDNVTPPSEPPSASDEITQKSPLELRTHKFVLPYFTDHVVAFAGAMRGMGIDVETLPLPDAETLACGAQHCSGKECHAYSIMAGDLVKYSHTKREGDEVFYFPGTQFVCLLSQYEAGLSLLLNDIGIRDLQVKAPPMSFVFELLGMPGLMLLWGGLTARPWPESDGHRRGAGGTCLE